MLIGEVAAAAGVGVSTLRSYERRGLLLPQGRTCGNYRQYPNDAPRTVGFIRRAQQLGLTLGEIGAIVHLAAAPAPDIEAALRSKVVEVEERMEDLHRMRAALLTLAEDGVDPRAPCRWSGHSGTRDDPRPPAPYRRVPLRPSSWGSSSSRSRA